jgi:hypothetical protein
VLFVLLCPLLSSLYFCSVLCALCFRFSVFGSLLSVLYLLCSYLSTLLSTLLCTTLMFAYYSARACDNTAWDTRPQHIAGGKAQDPSGIVGGSLAPGVLSVCCLLSVVCCLLSAACCLLSAVCRLPSTLCFLPSALCFLLSAVCCLLSAVCCLLSAVCCLLSAVCCPLSIGIVVGSFAPGFHLKNTNHHLTKIG